MKTSIEHISWQLSGTFRAEIVESRSGIFSSGSSWNVLVKTFATREHTVKKVNFRHFSIHRTFSIAFACHKIPRFSSRGDSPFFLRNTRSQPNHWKFIPSAENEAFEYTKVFRNLWDTLRELIVRLKIMKKSHVNICPICLRLWDVMNFINRVNCSKLVLPGMVHSIFIIIITGMKKTHVLFSRHQRQFSLNVWAGIIDKFLIGPFFLDGKLT